MDISQKKELFSIAYVRAIAAKVGFNTAKTDVDNDSIDLYLVAKDFNGRIRNPQLQLQLKCTSQEIIRGDCLHYQLPVKNYHELIGDNVLCPRYLVVVIVPDDVDSWIDQDEERLILKRCGYWVSIRNYPETTNTSTVSIEIPRTQILTPDSLHNLMQLASKGEYI